MKRDPCTNCKKRESCTRLCKGAERYVDQDHVPRETLREADIKAKKYFSVENFEHDFSSLQSVPGKKGMTNRELMVSVLLRCGFPPKNINKVLKLRTQAFNNLIRSAKEKMYN